TPSPSTTPLPWFDWDINRLFANGSGKVDGNVDQLDLFWFDQFARGLHCPSDSPFNEFQRLDGNDNQAIDGGDYTYIANVFLGVVSKSVAKGQAVKPANLCFGVPAEPVSTDESATRASDEKVGADPRRMKAISATGQAD